MNEKSMHDFIMSVQEMSGQDSHWALARPNLRTRLRIAAVKVHLVLLNRYRVLERLRWLDCPSHLTDVRNYAIEGVVASIESGNRFEAKLWALTHRFESKSESKSPPSANTESFARKVQRIEIMVQQIQTVAEYFDEEFDTFIAHLISMGAIPNRDPPPRNDATNRNTTFQTAATKETQSRTSMFCSETAIWPFEKFPYGNFVL